MNEEFAEVVDLAEKAQQKGVFKLADAIKGASNPTDSVEIYLDIESAYNLIKVNEKLINTIDEEESAAIKLEADELSKKILESRIVFNMRGIDQSLVEKIEETTKAKYAEGDDAWWREYLCALVAANITSVENAAGDIDQHLFTTEEAIELRSSLPAESWERLIGTMQRLTLATGYFKGLTDAGFLQKS